MAYHLRALPDEDEPASVIGARLRAVRRQKGMSLLDVEEVSGKEFKASVVGAYERGQRRIAVSRLQRLAQIYRVPVEQLLPVSTVAARDGGGHYDDDRPAAIDLARLERAGGPEQAVLRRYLHAIELQRQDFNGRVITIRRDDLRVIAAIFQQSPAALFKRLQELGILASDL
jgi:transcriptional regulator with XRE-family HTH domain